MGTEEMHELQYLRERFGNIGNRGRDAPGPLMTRDRDGRGDPRRSSVRGGSGPRHGRPDVGQRDDRRRDFNRKDGTTTPTVMPPLSLDERQEQWVSRSFEEHSEPSSPSLLDLPKQPCSETGPLPADDDDDDDDTSCEWLDRSRHGEAQVEELQKTIGSREADLTKLQRQCAELVDERDSYKDLCAKSVQRGKDTEAQLQAQLQEVRGQLEEEQPPANTYLPSPEQMEKRDKWYQNYLKTKDMTNTDAYVAVHLDDVGFCMECMVCKKLIQMDRFVGHLGTMHHIKKLVDASKEADNDFAKKYTEILNMQNSEPFSPSLLTLPLAPAPPTKI